MNLSALAFLLPLAYSPSGVTAMRDRAGDGDSANFFSQIPLVLILVLFLVVVVLFVFVIPALLVRRQAAGPRRSRRSPLRPSPPPDAMAKPIVPRPSDETQAGADPTAVPEESFIPINFHYVPSAGFLSRRMLAQARALHHNPSRPTAQDGAQHIKILEQKLAEQEEQLRSQQERLAWMEERLQTLNMDLRALRQLLHEQKPHPLAQPAATPWRLPLMRGQGRRS